MKRDYISYLFLAVVIIAGIIIYNPFLLYFQNDDFIHIPLSAQGELFQHNSFRPICDLSVMLDYTIWGKNAYGYHITNLILHCINCLLVYLFTKKISQRYKIFNENKFAPAATALLFFIYANHSEAVFWILGRSAMLGFFFFMLSCIFYLERERNFYFIISLVFAMLAWLSYESTWVLPIVFFAIMFSDNVTGSPVYLKQNALNKEKINAIVILTCFAVYLIARRFVTGEWIGSYESGGTKEISWISILENIFRLSIRSWLPPNENGTIFIAAALILFLIFAVVLIRLKRNSKVIYLLVMALWLVSLMPYVVLGIDTKGTESERFLYLPALFTCFILVVLITQIKKQSTRNISMMAIIILQLIMLNTNKNHYRFSGSVTQTFIRAVNQFPAGSKFIIDSVPQECRGALIYRLGFTDCFKWMAPNDSLIQWTQKHNDLILHNDYKSKIIKDPTGRFNNMPGNMNDRSAYMQFSDSVLWIYLPQ